MLGMRGAEWQRYHDEYVDRVEQEGLAAYAAAQITERADSGFVAAESQRSEVYAEMEGLVDAALGLHDFLLQNEGSIEFRPGATSASDPNVDPVLEIAAPAEQRTQMAEMFEQITGSLASLDRVSNWWRR
jgi:hypothetical protein